MAVLLLYFLITSSDLISEYNNHCELLAYNELAIASKIFDFIFVIIHMHEMRLRLKRFIHMSP